MLPQQTAEVARVNRRQTRQSRGSLTLDTGIERLVAIEPALARFPAQPASVAAARRFVTEALVGAGVTTVLDEARLLVSELATNAVVHARTDFSVTVHVAANRVYVEVRDGDPIDLAAVDPPLPPELGRHGLQIVDRLAGSWGSRIEDHGKVAWFSIDA
jgi:anti-sigma regulatory factor (Ser/Thr protein kinase)